MSRFKEVSTPAREIRIVKGLARRVCVGCGRSDLDCVCNDPGLPPGMEFLKYKPRDEDEYEDESD